MHRAAALIVFLLLFPGCGDSSPDPPETSERERFAKAIESVIAQDAAIADQMKQKGSNFDSSDFQDLVEQMKRIDLRECPAEFQQAYLRHRNAWAQAAPYVAKYEGVGGFFNAFVEGFTGSTAMEDDEKRIMGQIEETWLKVELIALQYGVHPGR